jgi:dTDP-4-dehydrorhamnose 3,5-epimerase
MLFFETRLAGVFEIHLEPNIDERGFFSRSWCREEFQLLGLNTEVVQCSISFNRRKGTLRGIHYQAEPHPETKLVRCTRGSIYDVIVDLRRGSRTFKEWTAVLLTATNRHMIYVPPGCGHGFLSLEDETEVFYQMSEFYHADLARGVRWDDPALRIAWPDAPAVISERDRTLPDFE